MRAGNARLRWLWTLGCVAAMASACGDGSTPTPTDTGTPPVDTGTPPADTGGDTAPTDTGVAPTDTGVTPMDTGSQDDVASDVTSDLGMDSSVDAPVDVPVDTGPAPCASNADCASTPGLGVCDTTTGRCVQCVASTDTCPASQHCDGVTRTCVAGCRSDEGCAGTDAGVFRCDTASHTCVACVTDTHCPLGQRCTGNACVPGCDPVRGCPSGQTCCSGGCVDTSTSTGNCGACGTACMASNGTAVCAAGACAVGTCNEGFGNCDSMASNGCETNTRSSVAHCGACGTACATRANASTTCVAGACGFTCNTGFADCDTTASNGCEVDTRVTVAHCGACGNACPTRANASTTCAAGACGFTCNTGFADCDGDATNGCEVDTRASASHCGRCGNACTYANAAGVCAEGTCGLGACNDGFGNCDTTASNGCEVDLRVTTTDCGRCGGACVTPNGAPSCSAGACGVASCTTGYGNCDGLASNGCEVNTNTNVSHCGACGTVCPARTNARTRCSSARCGYVCTEPYGDCDFDPANGCETNFSTDPNNCGGCGVDFRCAPGQVCVMGGCAASASCAAIHATYPTLASGTYPIDPDGEGPIAAYNVYCDMERHGGGWTLVGTVANGVARQWNSLEAFTGTGTFGSLTDTTGANFKSPAWSNLPGADLMVETEEYSFGFNALLGGRALGPYIAASWPSTCNRTWLRSGADFATNLTTNQQRMFGFTLRAHDDNAECFPTTNENAAVVFFAAECCWVNGLGNTPGGQVDWRTHDLSLLRLSRLTPTACTAGAYPCNANGLFQSSSGECYNDDPACKSRRARVFVR